MREALKNKNLILFYVLFGIQFVLYSSFNLKNIFNTGNDSGLDSLYVNFLIIMGLVIYLVYVIAATRKFSVRFRHVLITSALFSLVLLFAFPSKSADVFTYLSRGRVVSHYNENPYKTTYADLEADELTPFLSTDWSHKTTVHGPLFTSFSVLASAIGDNNLALQVLLFKVASIAMHLSIVFIIFYLTKSVLASLLYGWNPFVLTEVVGHMHLDIFMAFFTALGLLFISRKATEKNMFLSSVFLSCSAMIKYVSVIFLPFATVHSINRQHTLSKKVISFGVFVLGFLLVLTLSFAPYWYGVGTLDRLLDISDSYLLSPSPFLVLLIIILKEVTVGFYDIALMLGKTVFLLVYLILLVRLFLRKSTEIPELVLNMFVVITVLFLFGLNFWFDWYMITPMMLGALYFGYTKSKKMFYLIIISTAFLGWLTYFSHPFYANALTT